MDMDYKQKCFKVLYYILWFYLISSVLGIIFGVASFLIVVD